MNDLNPKRPKRRKSVRHKPSQTGAKGNPLDTIARSIDRIGEVRIGHHPIDFLQVVAGLLLIIGIWQAFLQASDLSQDLQRASNSSVAETADLARVDPGTDVTLGGRLGVGSDAFLPIDDAAVSYRFVLYKRQRWECKEDKDGSYKGTWTLSAYDAPDIVTLDGSKMAIRLDRPMNMSGDLFTLPLDEVGWGWRCDGRREGSIRLVGYRDGDSVCVFGRTRSDGVLLAERLHGGDCESFITYLEGRARGARKAGLILLGIGLLVEAVWLGIRVPSRLARRQR